MKMPDSKTIVVCGAGTMGSGIAQVCAAAGFSTIVYDVQEDVLQKAREAIDNSLQYLIDKQKISVEESLSVKSRLQFTHDLAICKGDLIIEAIVERMEIKVSLLTALAALNHETCILATNTSSLSVTALQERLPLPHRVAGLHFFNPAPVMKLVEIVKGKHTSIETIQTLEAITLAMGKTGVHCLDAPGFIVNHVARPYYLTGLRMVEQGIATPQTVDAALEAAGFKMGPFRLMDLIGIDINYSASQQVWQALGHPARLQPSALQQQKVADKHLGRKTKKGFYDY